MPEVKDKTTGQVIAKMPYDAAGKMAAEKMVAENPGYEIKDGAQRSEQMYAGGGQAGFNSIGNPMYKKGGKLKDAYNLKKMQTSSLNKLRKKYPFKKKKK